MGALVLPAFLLHMYHPAKLLTIAMNFTMILVLGELILPEFGVESNVHVHQGIMDLTQVIVGQMLVTGHMSQGNCSVLW